MPIKEGTYFPNFSLPNQDGEVKSLNDYKGQWLVAYFYPADDTPGCTLQGQSFTAARQEYEQAGIKVVGVSQDDVASHSRFCNKFGFEIELLADAERTLIREVELEQGVWENQPYWKRTTFVLNPLGVVAKVYEDVDPVGHERLLLTDIKQLKSQ